ncbi:predicted protein [Brucella abortus bv. 4 str. 292]|uniref:Uncharacterized protein n=6 Tax=Brucella TaxID=234 RepID=A9M6J0_BRUC2|nr:Hypothetical protein, conserved [Brucella canis ATCC 23365]ABY38614.1 Hypothetical protein, conserved [Brucella suis ATCC 23445]EEW90578.1 predicted protein [Brucella suis bv. 4 str. 40]EEX55721.1 predicted protein [Brucella abortus bv. 4 str. 292]EEX59541.1 predicted protein [Brucella abortus bv. 2 str. 86/8/59]EEX62171.1 predicted protein [Brucella abortus bv. 6 str. 870]EEX80854.1 predicted protein [Brucella abortus bv. 9 str. C68]EEX82974.1 predicted protein [Brucella abortus bv. 3 st
MKACSKSRAVRLQMEIDLRSGARKSPFAHAHAAFEFRLLSDNAWGDKNERSSHH